jgi:hypothetical protein
MEWLTACALGACGGAIFEVTQVWGDVITWQQARHDARLSGSPLPRLAKYVDLPAAVLVLATRLLLGAASGWVFHAQVAGSVAGIAVGASAPALLGQLGKVRAIGASGSPGGAESAATSPSAVIPPALFPGVQETGE